MQLKPTRNYMVSCPSCILCIVCFVSRFCFVDCSLLLGNVAEPTRRMVGQRQQKLAMTSTNHFVWQVCRSQLRFNTEQATRSLQKVLGTLLMTLCFDSIFKYKLFFPRMPTQEFKSYLLYDFLCSTTVGYIGTILNFQDGFFWGRKVPQTKKWSSGNLN